MQIKFWGVRGSIPAPSTAEFAASRYGGNTTCVSVRAPGITAIFDAGTGARNLGLRLAAEEPVKAAFFFSHFHWDHIQGFPFFAPAFHAGNSFDIHGPRLHYTPEEARADGGATCIEAALRSQQRGQNFPVRFSQMSANMSFFDLDEGANVILQGTESRLVITPRALYHPGGCFGYRVEEHAGNSVKTFVFATDTEDVDQNNPNVQLLARQADVLCYDAQYTEDEYNGKVGPSRQGWGHSTPQRAIREALAAGARSLLLTHHDPQHDDWAVARIEQGARVEGLKAGLKVAAAYEGMELTL